MGGVPFSSPICWIKTIVVLCLIGLIGTLTSLFVIFTDIDVFYTQSLGDLDEFKRYSTEASNVMAEPVEQRRAYRSARWSRRHSFFTSPSCPRGPVGPPGLPGPPGPDALDGPHGVDGVSGRWMEATAECVKCLPGPRGLPGQPGRPGRQGFNGLPGHPGRAGRNSAGGRQGPRGEPGEEGPPGRKGEQGPQGANGLKGPPGDRGRTGEMGREGLPGGRGQPGYNGRRGRAGHEGPIGARGEKGEDGVNGRPGERGRPSDRHCPCPVEGRKNKATTSSYEAPTVRPSSSYDVSSPSPIHEISYEKPVERPMEKVIDSNAEALEDITVNGGDGGGGDDDVRFILPYDEDNEPPPPPTETTFHYETLPPRRYEHGPSSYYQHSQHPELSRALNRFVAPSTSPPTTRRTLAPFFPPPYEAPAEVWTTKPKPPVQKPTRGHFAPTTLPPLPTVPSPRPSPPAPPPFATLHSRTHPPHGETSSESSTHSSIEPVVEGKHLFTRSAPVDPPRVSLPLPPHPSAAEFVQTQSLTPTTESLQGFQPFHFLPPSPQSPFFFSLPSSSSDPFERSQSSPQFFVSPFGTFGYVDPRQLGRASPFAHPQYVSLVPISQLGDRLVFDASATAEGGNEGRHHFQKPAPLSPSFASFHGDHEDQFAQRKQASFTPSKLDTRRKILEALKMQLEREGVVKT